MPADEASPLLSNDAAGRSSLRPYTSDDINRVEGSQQNGHAEEGLQDTKSGVEIAAVVSADLSSRFQ
jgi:hypothetical protein